MARAKAEALGRGYAEEIWDLREAFDAVDATEKAYRDAIERRRVAVEALIQRGASHNEIAKTMGVPKNTITSLVRRPAIRRAKAERSASKPMTEEKQDG